MSMTPAIFHLEQDEKAALERANEDEAREELENK